MTTCYKFRDYYNNEVELALNGTPFSDKPGHVWVICLYAGRWLLTRHSQRGLEFPGGKIEEGEAPEEAAVREVDEETGGRIEVIRSLGQYKVAGRSEDVIKNIYIAVVESLIPHEDYMETDGPVLIETLPSNIRDHPGYSFIMKDEVLPRTVKYAEEAGYITLK